MASFVSASQITGTLDATGSIAVPAPSGLVLGNLLIAFVFTPGAALSWQIYAPSGWAPLVNQTNSGTDWSATFVKDVDPTGDPSGWTFTAAGGASDAGQATGVIIAQYAGLGNAAAQNGKGGVYYVTTAATSFPASTGARGGQGLYVVCAANAAGETFTAPSGMTARASVASASVSLAVWDMAVSGTVPAETATVATATTGSVYGLVPAPGGPTAADSTSVSSAVAHPTGGGVLTAGGSTSHSAATGAPAESESAGSTSVSSAAAYPVAKAWPYPALQVLVGLSSHANDDPASITWTDISQWVRGYNLSGRGRQHDLGQMQAATVNVVLDNADGRFNPWNTASPYYPHLKPRIWLQVNAVWAGTTYPRFTGHVTAWTPTWDGPGAHQSAATLTVTAADPLRYWNTVDVTSYAYGPQVIADGPTVYYRLNDPAGAFTNPVDAMGGPAAGSLFCTFGVTPGALPLWPGPCCDLSNGTSGPDGQISPSVPINGAAQFTFEAWVNPKSLPASGSYWYLWGQTPGSSSSPVVAGFLGIGVDSNGHLFIQDGTSARVVSDGSGTGAMPAGAWSHVVVVYGSGVVRFYRNGHWDQQLLTISDAATPVSFGAGEGVTASGVFNAAWPGYMQELAIYNGKALTAAQVALHYQLGSKNLGQESTGARVTDVLEVIGWGGSTANVDTGLSLVQANTQDLTNISALSHLQSVEATEAGALFTSAAGVVQFLQRSKLYGSTPASVHTVSQATFGDNPGQINYQPGPALTLDDTDIYNLARVQRQGGSITVTMNPASITANGSQMWQPASTVLYTTDAEAAQLGQFVVDQHGTAVHRVDSITVDMLDAYDAGQVATLLSLDLLWRVTVARATLPGGGDAFDQDSQIEQISETVTLTGGQVSWTVTFALDATPCLPVPAADATWVGVTSTWDGATWDNATWA